MAAWASGSGVPITSGGCSRSFESSGLTRREFSQRHHIPDTTLDYWRRAQSRQARLVEVEVAAIVSVVESCRRLSVPVKDYLTHILPGMNRRKLSEVALLKGEIAT